jgi:hypothetical protein
MKNSENTISLTAWTILQNKTYKIYIFPLTQLLPIYFKKPVGSVCILVIIYMAAYFEQVSQMNIYLIDKDKGEN